MAYDKVVDSAVLNAGLKQIADAIREKGGTSGNLAFPAAMADAIAAIQAGGAKIEMGTIDASESVTVTKTEPFSVEHGLGAVPNFVCFAKAGKCTTTSQFRAAFYFKRYSSGTPASYSISAKSGGIETLPSIYSDESMMGISVDDAKFHVYANSKTIVAYTSYYWIAGVIK